MKLQHVAQDIIQAHFKLERAVLSVYVLKKSITSRTRTVIQQKEHSARKQLTFNLVCLNHERLYNTTFK